MNDGRLVAYGEHQMVLTHWGLLGPESLPSSRRTRTLGLGAAVRAFNNLAVPGLGGIWYAKQPILALLGVRVGELARAKGGTAANIQVANAIEALACRLAFQQNGWSQDARLRGRQKLRERTDFRFRSARSPSFYVSQPMRTASVQTLPALGLVDATTTRFNGFRCTEAGQALLDAALRGSTPYKRSLVDHLALWVLGQDDRVNTDALAQGLSPLRALPAPARELLRDRLLRIGHGETSDDRDRRRDALDWVESRRSDPSSPASWETRPDAIRVDEHWLDLRAGARFFLAREAALTVLDAVEARVPEQRGRPLDASLLAEVAGHMETLRTAAQAFLDNGHPNAMARTFCQECVTPEPGALLTSLIARDGRVLRLLGGLVCPGPAFVGVDEAGQDGAAETDEVDTPVEGEAWPDGVSQRIPNLFLLNLDLDDALGAWLDREDGEADQ
jgi:hypothetical protein